MTTQTPNNILSTIVAKPSKNDGTGIHIGNSGLLKFHTAVNDGILSATATGDTITYNVNGENILVSVSDIAAAAVYFPVYEQGKNLADTLHLFSQGYLISKQQKIASAVPVGIVQSVKPLNLLTAEQYRGNCFTLNRDTLDTAAIYADITAFNDKTTKADLLTYLQSLANTLLTDEQADTYAIMLEKEAKERTKFDFLGGHYEKLEKLTGNAIKLTCSFEQQPSIFPIVAGVCPAMSCTLKDGKVIIIFTMPE